MNFKLILLLVLMTPALYAEELELRCPPYMKFLTERSSVPTLKKITPIKETEKAADQLKELELSYQNKKGIKARSKQGLEFREAKYRQKQVSIVLGTHSTAKGPKEDPSGCVFNVEAISEGDFATTYWGLKGNQIPTENDLKEFRKLKDYYHELKAKYNLINNSEVSKTLQHFPIGGSSDLSSMSPSGSLKDLENRIDRGGTLIEPPGGLRK